MRDTRYIILVLLSSLLMLTGCSRRDVLDDYPVSGVEISLDWAGVTDELPEGVRIIFYPKDGEGRKVDRYLSVQGGEMKVPPGRYSVVAYNYNTEVVRIRGEESYETIEAYTGYCNGLGIAGTEKMVWSPAPLYVLNIDELKIKKSDVIGCVNGLSDCYCIGKGCGMCNSQPIYFEAKKEGGKVIAHFTAFKGAKDIPTRMSMLGEPVYREASSVKLILSFVRTDNTIQERTIDVTEIIGTLEKDEEEEAGKQDPPPEIELPPDDKIEVEKPETPPNPDGGGGMNGNVDGWGPEDNVELPVN